jgi:hypothetical protein
VGQRGWANATAGLAGAEMVQPCCRLVNLQPDSFTIHAKALWMQQCTGTLPLPAVCPAPKTLQQQPQRSQAPAAAQGWILPGSSERPLAALTCRRVRTRAKG